MSKYRLKTLSGSGRMIIVRTGKKKCVITILPPDDPPLHFTTNEPKGEAPPGMNEPKGDAK